MTSSSGAAAAKRGPGAPTANDRVLHGFGEAAVAVWERLLEVVEQPLGGRLGEPATEHVQELADAVGVDEVVLGAQLLGGEESRQVKQSVGPLIDRHRRAPGHSGAFLGGPT